MAKNLVIVESPAKAKTINKYLGSDYIVKSSVGHIRDLPTAGSATAKVDPKERAAQAARTRKMAPEKKAAYKKQKAQEQLIRRMGIDPDNNWKAQYQILPGKEKVVNELRQLAANSDAIYLATLAAILVTLLQVAGAAILTRKLEKMPLITLALLLVFGGATLALKDPVFIQWKPTAINWLFGLVFLGSHLIGDKPLVQRMMGHAIEISERRVWIQLNLAWVAFFAVAGIANMIVAPEIDPLGLQFSEDTWVDFKLFGLMGMTLAFVVAQAFYLARYMPNTDEETS